MQTELKMNVIFIDDDEDLNFLQERMCSRLKIIDNFFIASSGRQTLNYLEKTRVTPDIIFVDINMPIMTGFGFIEEYEKKFSSQLPDTHLFVISSSVREHDRQKALEYGTVKGFVLKPLTEEKIEEIYCQYHKS
jgi:response regulator of citrate/malate metabolism